MAKSPEDIKKCTAIIDRLEELGVSKPTIDKLREWLSRQKEVK